MEPGILRKVRAEVARLRLAVEVPALPTGEGVSPEQAAAEQRRESVRLALERAKKLESEAAWDECVKEAAGAMSDAIDVIAFTDDFKLVRDLDVQAGACMSLAGEKQGARLHFLGAALLDETPSQPGMHREEAERAQREAEAEIRARPRGPLRIVTEPSGAQVWIDGRLIQGTTPLVTDVRLGDHFVTVRRFRYEQNTEQRFLQPQGLLRITLDPAQRQTLRGQLAATAKSPEPNADETILALGTWSRAEHVVVVAPDRRGWKLGLRDVATGREIRTEAMPGQPDAAIVRRTVCTLLGETCELERSIPWYVWPLGAAALVGGALTTGILLDNNRPVRVCPPSGCR